MKKNNFKKTGGLVLLAIILGVSVSAQLKTPRQIIRNHSVDVIPKGSDMIRVRDGIIAARFGPSETVNGTTLKEKAVNYLKNNWSKMGITEIQNESVVFQSERVLAGTGVVRFRQYYKGLRVDQNELTIGFNKAQQVISFINSTAPVSGLRSVTPVISKKLAEQKAMQHLEQPIGVRQVNNELIVHIIEGQASLCYEITVLADNPVGEWRVYVDAFNGTISEVQNIAADINGTGSVYNTDPVTSAQTAYGTGNFTDNADADNTDLNTQQVSVTLPNITFSGGLYKLIGPYAEIVDHESPFSGLFTQTNNYFGYNRTNDAFEAVMCYYHIDKSMSYINNTLGITLMPEVYTSGVRFDPHGLSGGCNAHYTSGDQRIAFGSPSNTVDAAEDACIILHELGHGLHDWLITGGTGVSQVEGLSEGSADYWAKSYERSLGYWNPGEWGYDHVFFWGLQDCFPGRSTNFSVAYPGGLTGGVHNKGQLWSSTLMRIWNDIGKEKTDRMFLIGLSLTNTSTNQAGAANACYQAAVNLGYSAFELCIIWNHFRNTYGTFFTPAQPTGGADIFMQDTPNDFGTQVNPDNGPMWTSNDIWVRNTNDGGLTHQNPEFSTMNPNFVYVRVRGRGCTPVTDANLRLYYSKASTGLQWNSNWNNFFITQFGNNVLAGDEITTSPVPIPPLNPGEETIIAIPWMVPNPSDFESDIHHFCLAARIESATDPMFITEGSDINANTKNNNNIAWKNVSIFDNDPNNITGPGVFIRNISKNITSLNEIRLANAAGAWNPVFYKNGDVFITLSPELYAVWVAGGRKGNAFAEVDNRGRIKVLSDKFFLGGLKLEQKVSYLVNVYYKPVANARNCAFDLVQYDVSVPTRAVLAGGERFEYDPNAKPKEQKEKVNKPGIATAKHGSLLITDASAAKSQLLFPNPADALVQVNLPVEATLFELYNANGAKVKTVRIVTGNKQMGVSIAELKPGTYFVVVRDNKGAIIAKDRLQKVYK